MQQFRHLTVLADEAVALLAPREGSLVLDGTLGGGGHSELLLTQGARVVGIDRDPRAIAAAIVRLERFGERFVARCARYSEAGAILREVGAEGADGLLLDLGVSSPQLDEEARGFSFQADAPLDMRMGDQGETAAELLARLDEEALANLLFELGEEPHSRRIARALKALPSSPTRTLELARAVERAIPRKAWPKRIHPATRTFQALRIAVNDELGELSRALEALPSLLHRGGRAAIISFHSLEDRRVKEAFRALEGECTCPPALPLCVCDKASAGFRILTRKAVVASEQELARNPRARSAKLRAIERLP